MRRMSELGRKKVYVTKQGRKGDKLKKVGKVHMAVFEPHGTKVAGILVKRPDVAGMVKRADVFVALDALGTCEEGLLITNEKDSTDDAARKRLGLDWDDCVVWSGMDARTEGGRELGYVSDFSFDERTGAVETFFVGDGGVAESLVGAVPIPVSMLRRYSKGYMVVDDAAANLELSGGAAAAAGEATAKAKARGKEAMAKADDAASEAVDKGSKAFGKALGDLRRAGKEAKAEFDSETGTPKRAAKPKTGGQEAKRPAVPAENVQVSAPAVAGQLRASEEERSAAGRQVQTYKPVEKPAASKQATAKKASGSSSGKKATARKPAAKKGDARPSGDDIAREAGRTLSSFGKMFGDFADEYKKASK